MIAGFWIRLISDVLDIFLVGVFGRCLSIPFRQSFNQLGEAGVWVGLLVTFLYVAILQTKVGEGQSLAKKLLKIQVLKMNGTYLSLPMSLLRFSVIAFMFYHVWIIRVISSIIPSLHNPTFFSLDATLFLFLVAGTFLLVPFHPLKRGIHDLIADSVVVHKGSFDLQRMASLNHSGKAVRAYVIATSFAVAALVFNLAFSNGFSRSPAAMQARGRMQTENKIMLETQLKNVEIYEAHKKPNFVSDLLKTKPSLSINAYLEKDKCDNRAILNAEAQKAAEILIQNDQDLSGFTTIVVIIHTGFHFGLLQSAQFYSQQFGLDGTPISTTH